MFRNIVSNLPFSPALVGQLGFYAKRLRKEEATRRIGLIFTALALVVQSFAVFSPPTPANASSNADFVSGGISSVQEYLTHYDRNTNNIKDIFSSLGITRAEINAATSGTVGENGYYNWSLTSLYSAQQGQRAYKFYDSQGNPGTVYNRPMSLTQEGRSPYPVFIGHSKKFGWFAIKKDCGNLVTTKQPPAETPPESSCTKLTATLVNRTKVRFNAKGDVANGATIKSYTFTIKDDAGKIVDTKKVVSNNQSTELVYERTKPGDYKVSVVIDTSLGDKTDPNCRASFTIEPPVEPTAVCSSLKARVIGRTNVEMRGSAVAKNGATINKYVFVIRNSGGKEISRQVIASHASSVNANTVVVEAAGSYTAKLIVATSLGEKTDAKDCVDAFKIVPIATCPINPELTPNDPDCQPCPGDASIWIKDLACAADIIETKTANNVDQGKPANDVLAMASEKISYTISIENIGLIPTSASFKEDLQDVLEYSSIIDAGGGTFDNSSKTLTWPTVELKAGEKQSRTFVVQIASTIPATNTGTSNADSYNCIVTNTFGNSIDISVDCPLEKVIVEQVVGELPTTGPRENMIFAGVVLSIVVYFYARARQVNKEVRFIRRDLNAGTI